MPLLARAAFTRHSTRRGCSLCLNSKADPTRQPRAACLPPFGYQMAFQIPHQRSADACACSKREYIPSLDPSLHVSASSYQTESVTRHRLRFPLPSRSPGIPCKHQAAPIVRGHHGRSIGNDVALERWRPRATTVQIRQNPRSQLHYRKKLVA